MQKSKQKFYYLLIAFLLNPLIAQMNISTEIITVRDGLSNNNARDIIQDKYGYLWFATADGVNRYDGYEIKVYKNIPGDTTSLPANVTFRLYEDSQGTFWVSTDNGLARYNRNRDTFTTYRFTASTEETANRIIDIFEDSRKKLWVTAVSGTFEFDRKSGQFKSYEIMKTDNTIVEYTTYGGVINESGSRELYNICSGYGLLKFDYEASLFVQVALKDNFNNKLTNSIYWGMEFDQDNNMWLAISKGLYKIDLPEKRGYDITPFKKRPMVNIFMDNAIKDLLIDKDQNIWVGTGLNGIYRFDNQNKMFEHIVKPSSANNYQSFYLDNSGLLWFGSSRGLSKIDFDRRPFESYAISYENEEIGDRRIFSFNQISTDKNLIWLGTPKGMFAFDREKKTIIQSFKNTALNQLNNMGISSIVEQSNGKIWIATDVNGLWFYNPASSQLKNYMPKRYDNASLLNNNVHSLSLDKNENLWVGTHEGLHVLKNGENKFISIPSRINKKYSPGLIAVLNELRQKSKPISSSINVNDFADLTRDFVVRQDTKALIYVKDCPDLTWLILAGLNLKRVIHFGARDNLINHSMPVVILKTE